MIAMEILKHTLFFFLLVTQICFAQWYLQNSGTTDYLIGVSFTDANNGTVVGYNHIYKGIILRTTNGGISWTKQINGTTQSLLGVSFTDVNNGTAVGAGGTILRTTNGGTNWTEQTSVITTLYSVSFTDSNNGTAVGRYGTIFRTTNGGTNWTEQTRTGTYNFLYGVSFTDANNGWAVGEIGTILRTTNGGATFVEEGQIDEMPTEFLLSQNFPNPFNPSTSIQYAVSSRQFVKLTVYDLLGREIETLVNEEKPAGTYEITWYSENLPSGVYFYQLKAGSYLETKKMLLMK